MFLTASNLGSIQTAKIDLSKKLIVLCGQNNTGKTYLSYSIWAFISATGVLGFKRPKVLREQLQGLAEKSVIEINLIEVFRLHGKKLLESKEGETKEVIPDVFGVSKDTFKNLEIKIDWNSNEDIEKTLRELEIRQNIALSRGINVIIFKEKNAENITITRVENNEPHREPLDSFLYDYLEVIIMGYLTQVFRACHFLLAERIGISVFGKELTLNRSALVEKLSGLDSPVRAALLDLLTKNLAKYPGPIQEALRVDQSMEFVRKGKSAFQDLAEEIENNIFRAKLLTGPDGSLSVSIPNANTSIQLQLAGSTIKSLASFVLYLRHTAMEKDLLIFDEPEINLHPDNQRKIARIIAKLVNRGVHVLLSTHSDYIIRELNNLIMLNGAPPKVTESLKEKFHYNNSELLNKDIIGAYLFKKNGKANEQVEEIKITASGIEVETIDKEINELNLSSQEIFHAISEHESE